MTSCDVTSEIAEDDWERGFMVTSLLELLLVRRMSGAVPAASRGSGEQRRVCFFCHKQEDIQKLSSLDQQTCLCKGKFDTEYVLFTPHAVPVK